MLTECDLCPTTMDINVKYCIHPMFPAYLVGSDGSVWSKLTTGKKVRDSHKKMLPSRSRNGYLRVKLRNNGKMQVFLVHRLVLEVFTGICPKDMQACHDNGFRDDNRIENLRWDTPKGNTSDKVRHGTRLVGEKHPLSKVTDEMVMDIRKKYALGTVTYSDLAKEYGILEANIGHIILGRAWKHLPVIKCKTIRLGSRNCLSKLNESKVIEIRKLYKSGLCTLLSLAETFGVSEATIRRVCKRQLWKHVGEQC